MDPTGVPDSTICVVDDDPAVRDSLLLLLRLKGYHAAGFASAETFLASECAARGGCLLLDLRMPGMTGQDLQKELAARGIAIPIVVITAHGDVAAARAAFRAGAVDFLEKPLDEAALFAALEAALERDRRRRRDDEAAAELDARIARLTARERDVMWRVADGCQNREIAASLGLSPRTVEIHKARVMEKLRVRGLSELLRLVRGARRGSGGEP